MLEDNIEEALLFNSISVISGQWEDDNERLCAITPIYGEEDSASSGTQTWDH